MMRRRMRRISMMWEDCGKTPHDVYDDGLGLGLVLGLVLGLGLVRMRRMRRMRRTAGASHYPEGPYRLGLVLGLGVGIMRTYY
jgi:hypothetical protein